MKKLLIALLILAMAGSVMAVQPWVSIEKTVDGDTGSVKSDVFFTPGDFGEAIGYLTLSVRID